MAQIIPFKGLRYNQAKIFNLGSVVTPPYDVIDETAQAKYYAENPANIIRLELGLMFPQDTATNNRYTRAAQYLEKWLEDEILLPEAAPALYFYQQEFNVNEQVVIRNGFICGLKVEPYSTGNVLPHEETLSKPKADRLQLMRATQCNFSSIFGLYSDEARIIDNLIKEHTSNVMPTISIVDEAEEKHKIWVITDESVVEQIVNVMADKKVYIADGHHRYETALEYAQEMNELGQSGYDYVLTTLVNLYDEGLIVLPTHRVVKNIPEFNVKNLVDKLSTLFTVQELGTSEALSQLMNNLEQTSEGTHVYGMYVNDQLYLLTLNNHAEAAALLPADRSDAWKKLDVALLDNLILDRMLNIGEQERRNQDHLAYTRSEKWLVEQVKNSNYQVGFIINPTRVQEIVDVASARDKMPQKSTYFYPKLITGLVINHMGYK